MLMKDTFIRGGKMSNGLNWTEDEVRAYLGKFKTAPGVAVQTPYLESGSKHGLAAKNESQKIYPRFSIHIHSRRWRLADPDGISAKACIDGLVSGGILANDSAKEIESVTFSQEKVSKDQAEETIIEVWQL